MDEIHSDVIGTVTTRVAVMGHGRIVFEGSPQQLESDQALLAQWLAV